MPNRQLTPEELQCAGRLLDEIRSRLDDLSGGDRGLLFAFRRKVYKELSYDERSRPAARKRLKAMKLREQKGLCLVCAQELPETGAVLDRFNAVDGYSAANTRLIHAACDVSVQRSRGFA